jgi:hypothetical protein
MNRHFICMHKASSYGGPELPRIISRITYVSNILFRRSRDMDEAEMNCFKTGFWIRRDPDLYMAEFEKFLK